MASISNMDSTTSETFALPPACQQFATVLTVAAQRNWEIQSSRHQERLPNAEVKEDIYMRAPPGYLKDEDKERS